MRYLKHLVSIIAALTISSAVFANEIKMGKADWDTGYFQAEIYNCLLYTSPSPRDVEESRMPSSA